MPGDVIRYSDVRDLPIDKLVRLYLACGWSSGEKPDTLSTALKASHSLVTAWDGDTLVGLANAISDGHLVVYYPHLLVLPDYRRRGIGTTLMRTLMGRYEGFHQQMLVAEPDAIEFYRSLGFTRAGSTQSMEIYQGDDH